MVLRTNRKFTKPANNMSFHINGFSFQNVLIVLIGRIAPGSHRGPPKAAHDKSLQEQKESFIGLQRSSIPKKASSWKEMEIKGNVKSKERKATEAYGNQRKPKKLETN